MPTTLITGANRGIGLELARQSIAQGRAVIGTARNPDAATELRGLGAQVEQLDAADEESAKKLAERLAGKPIDLLINNAGTFPDNGKGFEELDAAAMNACFATNATGPLLVTRALLPNLFAGGEKKIINISSTMGSLDGASSATKNIAYRASKAALNMVNLLIANELKDRGVVSAAVHPGWVQTDMGGADAHLTPEKSATDILSLAKRLAMGDTGRFLSHDGSTIAW